MIDNEAEREKKEEEDCVVNELPDKVDEILKVIKHESSSIIIHNRNHSTHIKK